ncbi:hypothetical protein BH20VER1_BH20VER1_02390 [soil metagenome]
MITVVEPAASCSACGKQLGASGACVACLLRVGFDEAPQQTPTGRATAFGDFEIERRDDGTRIELGRGAMGVTYRARDQVLHRDVALKVIEPRVGQGESRLVRARFLREARAAAALRHPNIAAVFQFGELADDGPCYCAMELVEGETFEARVRRDGPITVDLALDLGIQVARALMAAAERELIHRDLKPGNIMLAATGDPARVEVKVIDFGLAKAVSSAGQMELTQGGFVGTPAFASPEQFSGGTVDARSDIYAFGATLWFGLTGRLPSAGTTIDEIRQRQAYQKLPVEQLHSRRVPPPLIELILSCLAFAPTERPASARELLRALENCRGQIARAQRRRQVITATAIAASLILAASAFLLLQPNPKPAAAPAAPALATEQGVAVLPFENLSPDKQDAFFADGMQDDVLTSLGKIKGLKVIARASVMDYRGARRAGKAREIGHALGVSHVLEGSVRRAGDRVAVSVALIDTRNESQVWAERYERTLADSISLQGELAVEIARALHGTLNPAETAGAMTRPTENADAYLSYLRGREVEIAGGPKAWEIAIQFYQQAVDLDPAFALARARLSICASEQAYLSAGPEWKERARAEAQEALRLRPELGEARLALACTYLFGDNNVERARVEVERAAELSPGSAEVALVSAFIYKRHNKLRERLAALQRAEALDPRNTRVVNFALLTRRWVRDWPEAIRALDRYDVLVPHERRAGRRRWHRANLEFQLNGDIGILKRVLAGQEAAHPSGHPEWLTAAHYEVATLERDYSGAAQLLASMTQGGFEEAILPRGLRAPKSFEGALLAFASGAPTRQQALETAAEELRALAGAHGLHRIDYHRLAELAIVYALLGRKEDAFGELSRAEDAMQAQAGSVERNHHASALALVYAHTGETEKAVEMVEYLLTVPSDLMTGAVYNMTLTDLKWRWIWDPLRNHPRFQRLLASPEPKTSY